MQKRKSHLNFIFAITLTLLSANQFYFLYSWKKIEKQTKETSTKLSKNSTSKQLREENALTRKRFSFSNPSYLQNKLESSSISFSEKPVFKSQQVEEKTVLTMQKTDCDLQVIKKVLSELENPKQQGAPQLIITKLDLTKKNSNKDLEYEMNFELLKREYHEKK